MKALELLKSQESILLEDSNASKKIQGLSSTLNSLIIEMNSQLRYFEDFASSQLNGDYNDKIVVAKSLAKFFEGNKTLLYKANLCCRTATRFLMPIASFSAKNADELYEQTKKIDDFYI